MIISILMKVKRKLQKKNNIINSLIHAHLKLSKVIFSHLKCINEYGIIRISAESARKII